MKEFAISLLICSSDSSSFEHVRQLIGEAGVARRWNDLEWIEVSYEIENTEDLSRQIDTFVHNPRIQSLLAIDGLKMLRIGVFFDSANANVEVQPDLIAMLSQHGLSLLLSCYPCSENDENTDAALNERGD